MTHWNQHGMPLEVSSGIARKPFKNFLNDNITLWKMNEDDELWPVSSNNNIPEHYLTQLKDIVIWLGKNRINTECSYSFYYYNEDYEDRASGGVNTNNEGYIAFCKINGDGIVKVKNF